MNGYYLWLLIIYFVYLYHKYEKKRIVFILFILAGLYLSCDKGHHFNEMIKGEVKAVYYNGIQVGKYLIKTKSEDYQLGDIIEAKVSLLNYFKKTKDGSFDEYQYFKGKNVQFVVYPLEIETIGHRFHLRNMAIDFIEKNSDQRLKGIYLYLLLGLKNDEIEYLSSMASSMAIIHIFAISGMHFSLLLKIIISFLSHFMSEKTASYFSLFFMGFYALCLEGNVAAWRSFLTIVFRMLGVKNDIDNFGLVGIIFLLCNPYIYLQTGFIYSMVLYFLVIHTKNINASNLFVYIGSMCLSTCFRYEIAPLGFLFGLLFNQAIGTLFPLFIVDVLTHNMLSTFCFYLYQGLLGVMEYVCQFNLTVVLGKPPTILIIAFFIAYIYALSEWDLYKRKQGFVCCLILFILLYIRPYLNPFGKVIMLDVGQGDCFIVSFPYHKETVMIDTGGLSYQDVALERIIPALKYWGIKKIDTIYISHQDFDHCGSLNSLVENYPVKNVVTDFIESKHQGVIFKQLNKRIYDNENDNSLVILSYIGGLSYLFTGDISSQIELDMIKQYPTLDIDVLKVGHHGSNSSSCNEFIQQTTPIISLVSVGKNNQYGHPSKNVLNRLSAYGSIIKRTDEIGTFCIYFRDEHSFIEKME